MEITRVVMEGEETLVVMALRTPATHLSHIPLEATVATLSATARLQTPVIALPPMIPVRVIQAILDTQPTLDTREIPAIQAILYTRVILDILITLVILVMVVVVAIPVLPIMVAVRLVITVVVVWAITVHPDTLKTQAMASTILGITVTAEDPDTKAAELLSFKSLLIKIIIFDVNLKYM